MMLDAQLKGRVSVVSDSLISLNLFHTQPIFEGQRIRPYPLPLREAFTHWATGLSDVSFW